MINCRWVNHRTCRAPWNIMLLTFLLNLLINVWMSVCLSVSTNRLNSLENLKTANFCLRKTLLRGSGDKLLPRPRPHVVDQTTNCCITHNTRRGEQNGGLLTAPATPGKDKIYFSINKTFIIYCFIYLNIYIIKKHVFDFTNQTSCV
jgi:hypothetical protein